MHTESTSGAWRKALNNAAACIELSQSDVSITDALRRVCWHDAPYETAMKELTRLLGQLPQEWEKGKSREVISYILKDAAR